MRLIGSSHTDKSFSIKRLSRIVCAISAIGLAACSSQQRTAATTPSGAETSKIFHRASPDAISAAIAAPIIAPTENNPDQLYTADTNTVWQSMRNGFQLDWRMDHPAIDTELRWYRNNPAFLYRASERSSRYLHYVVSALQQRNMPTELALLPIVESAYDPFAYSRSGAAGMWQFLPETATNFGLKRNWWYDGRKDVVASTDAALTYLQYLHDKFNGDWLLAVAAYNFGEGSIMRAVQANRSRGQETDFWHLSLREETRTYIPRLLALAKIVNAPHSYGINLYAVPNEAYFAAVDTRGQLDLAKAASLANVDIQEIYRLNPAFSHAATDPQGQQKLLLPVRAIDRFNEQLALMPADERAGWKRYEVAKGDTLAAISRKFGVDASAIRSANQMPDGLLHPGQSLVIPRGRGSEPQAIAQTSPTTNSTQPALGARQVLHTVAAGENLLRISQRYGVTIPDIQRWNGMQVDDPVKLGQHLSIWTAAKDDKEPAKQVASQKVGYTVQNGDSLTAIASRFNVQIDDILRWNQVNPRSLLQPGQKLTLYPAAASR